MMRAFDAALNVPWAIQEERLDELLAIANRENDAPTPEALEAYRSNALARAEQATRRGDVAVVNAIGPFFRRANLMTEFSGATSYDIMRRDLQVALDDPTVNAIVLNVDSPGGEVNGIDELAKAVYNARDKKRIVAYVGGTGASAAYWLASAAGEVVMSDAAIVGSIGVVMGMMDTSKRDDARGVKRVEFVSSQSPDKRPDINSDVGRARIQKTVDDLAAVFINAVSTHRGVDAKTVAKEFGQGGVIVGANAVAIGMADRLGSFEALISELQGNGGTNAFYRSGGTMSTTNNGPAANAGVSQADHDAAVTAARIEGATNERVRIRAIMGCEHAAANAEQASHLAYETDMAADAAVGILAKGAKPAPVAPAASAEKPPVAGTEADAYAAQRAAGLADANAPKAPAAASWGDVVASSNARRRF